MSIGQRIAQLRKAKGWTQAQLAKQTQLSASTIAMYETSRRSPDDGALEKLASALEIDKSSLLEADSQQSQVESHHQKVDQVVTSNEPPHRDTSLPNNLVHPSETKQERRIDLGNFSLSNQEARLILFLRMNQDSLPFIESYITAERSKREQLEATWRLINEFHPN